MGEYACSVKRDDIVELLFEEFTTANFDDNEEAKLSAKNAKGRLIVRSLIQTIKEQEYPKLIVEYELLAQLLREYGSASTVAKTVSVVVSVQKQTYMHYINKLRMLEDPTEEQLQTGFRR